MPYSHLPEQVAAVDLGSNSFHLVVARVADGRVHVVDRLKEMVRLGAGLDENRQLTPEAQRIALDCLERFGQRLRDFPKGTVAVVGTNTLRSAKNSAPFIAAAEASLGHPIAIISGLEEARLIYQGVAHTLADDGQRRLVIDIGGGSTEFALGAGYDVLDSESLYMGCVSMSRRYFEDGLIGKKMMRKAEIAAQREVLPLAHRLRRQGWVHTLGTSGTILSIARVLRARGLIERGISRTALRELRDILVEAGDLEKLELEGLSERRRPVFPGGVAVLLGILEVLEIDDLMVSEGALREGLLHELLGRIRHEDIRQFTVDALGRRCHVDEAQAARVSRTALELLGKVASAWSLEAEEYRNTLRWAAQLHEIGLSIAHNQYHKHGAYLLEHSDMAGFTRDEQRLIAALVRGHRRKFPLEVFQKLPESDRLPAMRLCMILRLAVTLHRERSDRSLPEFSIAAITRGLKLSLSEGWLEQHPLTQADLAEEAAFLKAADLRLRFA
ncbi:MAG: exopolyphosphatase [Gammaproteobacteria bacterium]